MHYNYQRLTIETVTKNHQFVFPILNWKLLVWLMNLLIHTGQLDISFRRWYEDSEHMLGQNIWHLGIQFLLQLKRGFGNWSLAFWNWFDLFDSIWLIIRKNNTPRKWIMMIMERTMLKCISSFISNWKHKRNGKLIDSIYELLAKYWFR